MRRLFAPPALALVLAITACATPPTPIMPADEDYDPDAYVSAAATPLVESPPIEPIEPPLPAIQQRIKAAFDPAGVLPSPTGVSA